ncbi:MAG: iron-containing alcohol dehydrogenase [Deltaproteobacteria bacterium]|nr:iron-containing alcohol dehydrogenase [Deltaproteobacteria bacterium]
MTNNDLGMKFDFPTSWRHGRGMASETGKILKELGCKKTLLVTDGLLIKLGVVRPVIESLQASKIEYTVCDEVSVEPTVTLFENLVEKYDPGRFDSVLAVGGGSVIDVTKALALIAQFGGHIRDYSGLNKVPAPLDRKVITIPTTSGTGSEISDGTVFIDEAIQSKFLVLSTFLCPKVAITDPLLTLLMPPGVTANSGVDALTHGIESYLSKDASIVTRLFSLKAVELISGGLKRAYDNGKIIEARETVQVGATMAMIAGMNAHMGLCHAMIMPLCALYHMPHGKACGMTLPHVMAYNAEVAGEKIADIFRAMKMMGDKGKDDGILSDEPYEKLNSLLRELKISARLKDFGYKDSHMKIIVQETFNSVQCQFNPRKPSEEDIVRIVEKMI